jgi:hypothetical protein
MLRRKSGIAFALACVVLSLVVLVGTIARG